MAPTAVRRRQTLGLQGGERGDALEGVAWPGASRPQTSSPKLVLITTQRDRLILTAPSCLASTWPPPARCATAAGPRRYIYGPLSNDRRCRCREWFKRRGPSSERRGRFDSARCPYRSLFDNSWMSSFASIVIAVRFCNSAILLDTCFTADTSRSMIQSNAANVSQACTTTPSMTRRDVYRTLR